MKPITRKEYYLAKAAGTYTGPTPPPVLREDYYLATLAGDYSGNCPAPVTRLDMFMSAAAGLTSYVPQPVTRIEKYWYAIAKGTGYVPEPVTREEKFLYAILKNPPKPEYLDKTAEGSLILFPDSAEAPLTALTVYGHSTQDGTPTPDNPVPIVSAGNVMTTGAQLLNINSGEISGSNIENITNTLTSGETYTYTNIDSPVPTIIGGRNASGDYIPFDNGVYASAGNGFTFVMPDNVAYLILGGSGGTIDKSMRFMLNSGSTALPWEPYTGGIPGVNPYAGEINVSVSDGGTQSQTLTLSTPGGLPGIPVDSGGNYTDENGQRWLCDEIDLARGKYVQRVIELDFDGAETWSTWGANNFTEGITGFYSYISSVLKVSTKAMLSNLLQYAPGAWGGGANGINVSTPNENQYIICSVYNDCLDDISTDDAAIESWKNILNTNNLHAMLILQDPIETDLTAEEIAAYKALHTYSPTTTVSNDAEAWMKVGYKAIP